MNVPAKFVKDPLLIAQRLADDLVLPDIQERSFYRGSAAGLDLQYRDRRDQAREGEFHCACFVPDAQVSDCSLTLASTKRAEIGC